MSSGRYRRGEEKRIDGDFRVVDSIVEAVEDLLAV
jgi:hypothetical protein